MEGLQQGIDSFAVVDETKKAEEQVIRARAPARPPLVPVIAGRQIRVDVGADGDQGRPGRQDPRQGLVVLLVRGDDCITVVRQAVYDPAADSTRLGKEIGHFQVVKGHNRSGARQGKGSRSFREKVDGRVHGIGRCLVLDVHDVRPVPADKIQENRPARPTPPCDDWLDAQRWQRTCPLGGGHVDLGTLVVQSQAKLARIVAHTPLHGGKLARDHQDLDHWPAAPFVFEWDNEGRRPEPSTWR